MSKTVINKSLQIDKLDKNRIIHNLAVTVQRCLAELLVFESVSSTNDRLLEITPPDKKQFVACIANYQSAGRGRNGHVWQSPVNANIYMSVGHCFELSLLDELSGLSLACGVAVARLLKSMGLSPSVKWPNDILLDGKKLAGILIETRIKSDAVYVVVGIGLNVKMSDIAAQKIDCEWTDLDTAFSQKGSRVERNAVASLLLDAVIDCCVQYKQSGFDSFEVDWKKFDCLTGCKVLVKTGEEELLAEVKGINEKCALCVEINNEEKIFYAADITLDAGN